MIAVVQVHSSSLRVELTPQEGDKTTSGRARAGRRSFGVWAPDGLTFDGVHPDLIALSLFLVAHPWTTEQLVVKGVDGISDTFADTLHSAFGIELQKTGAGDPRPALARGRSGLAFSGGVDSTAAMALMPPETPLLFMNRVGPDRTASGTTYQSDAALHALHQLSRWGHETYVVDTDLEHTRRPTGFPTHWANAIPCILFADQLDLHSLSWGTILEAAYSIGTAGFQDWSRRPRTRKLQSVVEAVGLPASLVVGGLSEVATAKVVLGSRYASITQSCITGSIEPCGRCKKCFRKGLLDKALTSATWSQENLSEFYRVESVRAELSTHPLHLENVYGFLLSNYTGSDEVLTLLRRQVQTEVIDYTLFERYYAPHLDHVHPSQRTHVTDALDAHLEPMSEAQEGVLQSWRATSSEDGQSVHEELVAALERQGAAAPERPRDVRDGLGLRTRLRQLLGRASWG